MITIGSVTTTLISDRESAVSPLIDHPEAEGVAPMGCEEPTIETGDLKIENAQEVSRRARVTALVMPQMIS